MAALNIEKEKNRLSGFIGMDKPNYSDILNCMHCGMCLPTCPTYALNPLEKANPRGRIALIKAVADGELEISDEFISAIYSCLNCRACETVCPAGVKYGELQEAVRAQIYKLNNASKLGKIIKIIAFEWIFTSNIRLKLLGYAIWLYEKSGLQWFIRKSKILHLISPHIAQLELLTPQVQIPYSDQSLPELWIPPGEIKYKVGFITGCIMNLIFGDINRDTAEVLYRNKCQIYTPRHQSCCGSLHGHNGDLATARILAKNYIDIFDKAGVDYIIINSAGCGSFLKQYGHLLRDDQHYAEKAQQFDKKVKDISEFLVMINFQKPQNPIFARVSYHDACHLVHGQKIFNEPRAILNSIPGLELIELPESTWCCGSAGIYNIIRYDDSMRLLNRKMQHIISTGADIISTANPGCIVQIEFGCKKENLPIRTLHPITLLNMAYNGKTI